MNALIAQIAQTRPEKGRVCAWWLGQMGFVLKKGNTTLLIDAFLSPRAGRRVKPAFSAEEALIFDAVLGSHSHDDHIDRPAWRTIHARNPRAAFLAPAALKQELLEDTGISVIGLKEGETLRMGEFIIDVIPAAHEFIYRSASGEPLQLSFIIDKCILHAGDTLRYEGQMAKLRAFGGFKAAILPINGRDAARYRRGCIGNMTFQEAVDLAGELAPEAAIPAHWDMFSDNSEDPQRFRDYLNAKYPQVNCLIPAHYEKFEIAEE